VKIGAFYSLSSDYFEMGRQVANIANRIIHDGEKMPPIIYPEVTNLMINKRVADKIGIKVSNKALKEAKKTYNRATKFISKHEEI